MDPRFIRRADNKPILSRDNTLRLLGPETFPSFLSGRLTLMLINYLETWRRTRAVCFRGARRAVSRLRVASGCYSI